ncbi:unnamed protein product [Polarella glacialis]|uniref:Ubiquitin-like protease family profile domain-containing protein n=1 Tax=Polarella glacialis TaxID=89957 RepID=A0A813JGE7_POLGL|nr:unnamed protein product [Polarella glacialis]
MHLRRGKNGAGGAQVCRGNASVATLLSAVPQLLQLAAFVSSAIPAPPCGPLPLLRASSSVPEVMGEGTQVDEEFVLAHAQGPAAEELRLLRISSSELQKGQKLQKTQNLYHAKLRKEWDVLVAADSLAAKHSELACQCLVAAMRARALCESVWQSAAADAQVVGLAGRLGPLPPAQNLQVLAEKLQSCCRLGASASGGALCELVMDFVEQWTRLVVPELPALGDAGTGSLAKMTAAATAGRAASTDPTGPASSTSRSQVPDVRQQTSMAVAAVVSVCAALAADAYEVQSCKLAVLEARGAILAASSEAAGKAETQLRRTLLQSSSGGGGSSAKSVGVVSFRTSKARQPQVIQDALQAAKEEAAKQRGSLASAWDSLEVGRGHLAAWEEALEVALSSAALPGRRQASEETHSKSLNSTGGREGACSLSVSDWVRMEEGQHLNDSLINHFIGWMVRLLGGPRVHAFSSHFFPRLSAADDDWPSSSVDNNTTNNSNNNNNHNNGWSQVRTWTRGLRRQNGPAGIFACDFLFVPLHHEAEQHWSLAIISKPWAAADCAVEFMRAVGAAAPCTTISFLDSLGRNVAREAAALRQLSDYLACEWRDCMGPDAGGFQPSRIQAVPVDVPAQPNSFDCGIYVLEFVLQLLRQPGQLQGLGRGTALKVASEPRQRWRQAGAKLRAEANPKGPSVSEGQRPGESGQKSDAEIWLQALLAAQGEVCHYRAR